MKVRLKFIGAIFAFVIYTLMNSLYAADISTAMTPQQLLTEACPEINWKGLKYTIDIDVNNIGASTSTAPWQNVVDKEEFKTYVNSYLIKRTLSNSTPDNLANDALTIASQCIMRRNAVVDAQFGRSTNSGMPQKVIEQSVVLILTEYLKRVQDRERFVRDVEWTPEPTNLQPLTDTMKSSVMLILREYLKNRQSVKP